MGGRCGGLQGRLLALLHLLPCLCHGSPCVRSWAEPGSGVAPLQMPAEDHRFVLGVGPFLAP